MSESRDAVLSECGLYRYSLTRIWDAEKQILGWCMLNPSTADACEDDRTIAKCKKLAAAHGFGGIVVGNLFAFRSTNPLGLLSADDPVGPDNDAHILALARVGPVVAAWGTAGTMMGRDAAVKRMLSAAGADVHRLSVTKYGHPGHPLYLSGSSPLEPFSVHSS